MTVHVVVPVFNRLSLTQNLIACLRRQTFEHPLRILVINDGSTDGTTEWLATQSDIDVLLGDGSLFWGGAVDLALRHLQAEAAAKDWVLLMNNDTTIEDDFVKCLHDAAETHAPAAVGSVIRDETDHTHLLSIGANLDAWRLLTRDILDTDHTKASASVIEVDALSGRGVLFSLEALSTAGGMRPRALPHYLADYDVSVRVRKSGWRLLVLTEVAVYSADDYGSAHLASSLRDKLFSVRSPLYLPAILVFWWEASNWPQRLSLLLRLPLFIIFPWIRKPV